MTEDFFLVLWNEAEEMGVNRVSDFAGEGGVEGVGWGQWFGFKVWVEWCPGYVVGDFEDVEGVFRCESTTVAFSGV